MGFNTHDLGDLVPVRAIFTDPDDESDMDPDVVKLSVKTPAGAVTTYVYLTDAIIIKDSIGHYHADIDVDEAGRWFYRWWSTGDGQAADEKYFEVEAAQAM